MKAFHNPKQDYSAKLRLRILIMSGFILAGALMLILSLTVFPEDVSDTQDFLRGFYRGAGSGMIVAAVFFIIRSWWLLRHDKARRTAEINEKDERRQYVGMRTAATAGFVCLYLHFLAILVAAPLNFTVFLTLLMALYVSSMVQIITYVIYNRIL